MFDSIIGAIAQQFGLGDKAKPFVQMLLAFMSDPSRGGLSGFVQKLRSAGVGSTVDGWIARPGDVAELDGPTVERTLGGDAVSSMTSKLGLDRGTIMKALGFAIPSLVARLAKGGNLPSALPAEAESFIGNRSAQACKLHRKILRQRDELPRSESEALLQFARAGGAGSGVLALAVH